MSAAQELTERFWKLKASRVRVSPSHTTRASSIGQECERFLVYERTAGELRTPHTPELQAIFDLGNTIEPHVVHDLEAMGCEVLQRGKDYHDRNLELTGHVDAKIKLPGWAKAIPAEIKGLNPYTATTIERIEDIKGHPQAWVRKYYAQLQVYLYLDGSDMGVFALLNKVTGAITFVDCPLDYAFAESLLKKAERVRDAVRANVLPARHQTDECQRCAFAHVCLPDIDFGKGATLLNAPELEAMLKRRDELQAAARELRDIDEAIKSAIPKKDGVLLLGDWSITPTEVQRKAYSVAAGSYWKNEIKRVTKEKSDASEQQKAH